jgi:hypothetical protein
VPAPPLFTQRALNRATLARQMLLQRASLPLVAAVEHHIGLQGQVANAPYLALWARVEGFRFDELTRLIETRKLVRAATLRGTLHLMSARDLLAWRSSFTGMMRRALQASHGKGLSGLDLDEVCDATLQVLADGPLTYADIGQRLRERWPQHEAGHLSQVARCLDALVQVPPAGTWGWTRPAPMTPATRWLGKPLKPPARPDKLLLRYLAAFGPASLQDMTTWSGLGGLREAIERLRPKLLVWQDDRGRELFDLPEAPRPDPDTLVPVRLLAPFDNLVLSHEDRRRVVADAHRPLIATVNGLFAPTFLVDGMVSGVWKLEPAGVVFEPFMRLGKAVRDELEAEAAGLLAALPGADGRRQVRFAAPKSS